MTPRDVCPNTMTRCAAPCAIDNQCRKVAGGAGPVSEAALSKQQKYQLAMNEKSEAAA